ncbi:MAG: terminase [Proteobacteria bacterium]|nr:terminase [Pseudomonadota bacterium]
MTIHSDTGENPDANYSRANYYNLIEKGNEALDGILEVAKESQHPRAYEVAANMIKNLSDVTEKLMILQKQQLDLKPKEAENQKTLNIDKAVIFTGSTTDLLKQIRAENEVLHHIQNNKQD